MIPNFLTITRIVFSLVIIILLNQENNFFNLICLVLFVFGSITDYLDGFFARLFNQTSKLGAILDPISDKLLVCGTLIALISISTISDFNVFAASIIILREIFVSGLREFFKDLNVSKLSKYKTFTQMIAIVFLIPNQIFLPIFFDIGIICLWVAALLSFLTGIQYLIIGINQKN